MAIKPVLDPTPDPEPIAVTITTEIVIEDVRLLFAEALALATGGEGGSRSRGMTYAEAVEWLLDADGRINLGACVICLGGYDLDLGARVNGCTVRSEAWKFTPTGDAVD